MAVVTFELKDLKDLGISKQNVESAVDRLGMQLESIDEKEVSIDITPNRPDMLTIFGFAKAVNFLLAKTVPKEGFYSLKGKTPTLKLKVTGDVKKIQPYIAALVVKNVNLSGNNLKNLVNFTEKFCDTYGRKRKKLSMGLYNFDSISGQLTYGAFNDDFVPLGTSKRSSIEQILKEHPKGKEYGEILGKTKTYPMLKDSKNVLALIPIVNSESTKVTISTKNIFVDITANSRNAAESAINLVACIFIDMGADVYPCEIAYKNKTITTPQLEYREIRIRKSKAENTLGFWLEDNKVINLVNKLGYVAAKYGKYTDVFVPPYRLDVLNDQDIIEDIAIAYGYENIAPMPILGSSIGQPDALKEYSNKIAKLMIGLGFSEAMNTYLTNEDLNFTKLEHKHDEASIIRVAYAKTESITMLRTQVMPSLIDNLSNSVHEKMPQRLFETGSVFSIENGKVSERNNLAIVAEHSKANYSEIKSVVLEFLKFAGIKTYKLSEIKDNAFIDGRSAEIKIGNETLCRFGEISLKVLSNFKLEEPVIAAEINIDLLVNSGKSQ